MSKTVTEEEVEDFVVKLRAGDADKKVNLLQLWGLKLEEVTALPERSFDAVTLTTSPFVRSSSHLLVTSTLSAFLPFYLPLIPPTHLQLALVQYLPGLLEKLNDPKDKVHDPAKDCIAILGRKSYDGEAQVASSSKGGGLVVTWENAVKDTLGGRGSRAKIGALKLLLAMREDPAAKLPLKPWLAGLVNLLEDSDGSVRDQARETVVALLSPPSTPPAARSELKKLMLARNVRKSIADGIISRVLGGAPAPSAASTPATVRSGETSQSRSGAATPAGDEVAIVYIASGRDLENEFRAMIPHFAGKETEHNWGPREAGLVRIRGMLRGKVFDKAPEAFLAGLKAGILEGLGKTLLSLRTTVAQQACALVQELAETLGPAFDSSVEHLLPILGKMAGFTKKIIADKSQRCVKAIIVHSTVHPRMIVSHIAAAINDKSVQTRNHGVSHLKTFLAKAGNETALIEGTPGLVEQLDQLIRKCLSDINAPVRETGRLAFWDFERLWPQHAAAILNGLDGTARKQLDKANPKTSGGAAAGPSPARPSKPRASSAMSAMLAAKRAKAAEMRAAAGRAEGNGNADVLLGSGEPVANALELNNAPQMETNGAAEHGSAAAEEAQSTAADDVQLDVAEDRDATPVARAAETAVEMPLIELATPAPPQRHHVSTGGQSSRLPKTAVTPRSVSDSVRRPIARVASASTTGRSSAIKSSSSHTSGIKSSSSHTSTRSRSSSLARTLSRSPPSLMESMHHPIRQTNIRPSASSSETSTANLRTPVQQAFPFPKVPRSQPSAYQTPGQHASSVSQRMMASGRSSSGSASPSPRHSLTHTPQDPAEEARRAQAAQGLSAAMQLLEFDDDHVDLNAQPETPVRAGHMEAAQQYAPQHSLRTPLNVGVRRQVWQDSPRAMTPNLLQKLRSGGHERSWWAQRQAILAKAAPMSNEDLKDAAAIEGDLVALSSGTPDLQNLQRLTQFSSTHPIESEEEADEYDITEQQRFWEDNRLFTRLFDGLMAYMVPSQASDLLEQSVVLLSELVQNQWAMCDNREDALMDALFRLRGSTNPIILEATNLLVSLLTEMCDPPFLLSILHSALARYLSGESLNGAASEELSSRAKSSGYSFGLTAMGMCILRLPTEAVEVEARRLEQQIMGALQVARTDGVLARRAAHAAIVSIQCMLGDDVRTLSLFPRLDETQRNMATYLMEDAGVRSKATPEVKASRRESVLAGLREGLADGAKRGR